MKSWKNWKMPMMGVLALAVMGAGAMMGAGPAAPATGPATLPSLLPAATMPDCCDPEVFGAADTQAATRPGLTMRGTGTFTITGGSARGAGGGQMTGTITFDGGTMVLVSNGPATEPGTGAASKPDGIYRGEIMVSQGSFKISDASPVATTIDGKQVVYSAPAVAATEPGVMALPELKLPPVTVGVSAALQQLHDVDAGLKSFTAAAVKEDTDPRNPDTEVHTGAIYYQKNKGTASLALQVDSLIASGMRGVPQDQVYAFVSPYFISRDNLKKSFERDEIVKPGTVVDPLKIGSGLLPLPIGQDPAAMVRDFDITEIPLKDAKPLPAGADAKDMIVLKLVPRMVGAYDFKYVTLTVDKKLSLPVVIDETKLDGNAMTFTLTKIEENKLSAAAAAKEFDTTAPTGTGWNIKLNPK